MASTAGRTFHNWLIVVLLVAFITTAVMYGINAVQEDRQKIIFREAAGRIGDLEYRTAEKCWWGTLDAKRFYISADSENCIQLVAELRTLRIKLADGYGIIRYRGNLVRDGELVSLRMRYGGMLNPIPVPDSELLAVKEIMNGY